MSRFLLLIVVLLLSSLLLEAQIDQVYSNHSVLDSSRFFSFRPAKYYTPDQGETRATIYKTIEFGMCDDIESFNITFHYIDNKSNPPISVTTNLGTSSSITIENRCDVLRQFFSIYNLDTFTTNKIAIEATTLAPWGSVTVSDTVRLLNGLNPLTTRSRGNWARKCLEIDGVGNIIWARTITLNDRPFIDSLLSPWEAWQRWDWGIPDTDPIAAAGDLLQADAELYDKLIIEEITHTQKWEYFWYGNPQQSTIFAELENSLIPTIMPAFKEFTRTILGYTVDEPSMNSNFNTLVGTDTHIRQHRKAHYFYNSPDQAGGRYPTVSGLTDRLSDKPLWHEWPVTGQGGVDYYHPGWKSLLYWDKVLYRRNTLARKYGHSVKYSLISAAQDVTASFLHKTEKEYKSMIAMLLFNGQDVLSHYQFSGVTEHRYQRNWFIDMANIIDEIEPYLTQDIPQIRTYTNPLSASGNHLVTFWVGSIDPQNEVFIGYVNNTRSSITYQVQMPWLEAGATIIPVFPGDDIPSLVGNTFTDNLDPLEVRYIKVLSGGLFKEVPEFIITELPGGSPLESHYPGTDFESISSWQCTGCSNSLITAQSTDRIRGNALQATRDETIASGDNLWIQDSGNPLFNAPKTYQWSGWIKWDSTRLTSTSSTGWTYFDANNRANTDYRIDAQGSLKLTPLGFQGWVYGTATMNAYDPGQQIRIDFNQVNMIGGNFRSGYKLDEWLLFEDNAVQPYMPDHIPSIEGINMVQNPSFEWWRLPNYPNYWRPFARDRGTVIVDKGDAYTHVKLDDSNPFHGKYSLRLDLDFVSEVRSKPTNISTRRPDILTYSGNSYTISFYARASEPITITLTRDNLGSDQNFNIGTNWNRYHITGTASSDGGTVLSFKNFPDIVGGKLWLDAVQVELNEGGTPTSFDDSYYIPDIESSN